MSSINDVLIELEILRELIITNNEQHKKVVRRLTSEIINMRRDISRLKQDPVFLSQQNEMSDNEDNVLPLFPLNTVEDLQDFEDNLTSSDIMVKQLKTLLLRTGEENTKMADYTRLTLKKLITDECAASHSWSGTKDKPSIKNMMFVSLLKEACHRKYEDADDKSISNIIQNHFLHAKDRLNKRQKKFQK